MGSMDFTMYEVRNTMYETPHLFFDAYAKCCVDGVGGVDPA